jgi:hypothetical protein
MTHGLRRRLAMAFAMALLATGAASTEGRDFAGFYRVENVSDVGELVALTLVVRLHNHSDTDVIDAAFVLVDSVFGEAAHSAIASVSVPARESVRLTSEVMVPSREYEHWRRGGHPQAYLDILDGSAALVRRPVEMSVMVLGEEEQS